MLATSFQWSSYSCIYFLVWQKDEFQYTLDLQLGVNTRGGGEKKGVSVIIGGTFTLNFNKLRLRFPDVFL